jgi:O-Antigen ligase
MISDMLLALGLLLSTASQLRLAGAKIGPGEACLLIWLVLSLVQVAGRLGPPLSPVLTRLLAFWMVFALAMSIGTMTGFATGDLHDPMWFQHDAMAYVLAAVLSCLFAVEPGAWSRLRRVAWLLATLGASSFALQLACGWDLIVIGDVDPWSWDRFRGFSANANQLALVSAVLGLLSLHLAETANRLGGKITALICAGVAIVVGRLTKSDSFLLVLVAAGPIFIVLKLRTWLQSPERRLTLRSAAAWILVLALPLMLAGIVPLGSSISLQAEDLVKDMAKGTTRDTEETARVRFLIWGEAVSRGVESGMLGLGPGPHLEIPSSILAGRRSTKNDPKNMEHPKWSIAPNFEAHNTLLDLFTQGGLLVVASFVWLMGATLLMTSRARLDGLTTLLCGLALFSIFHLIVRHPIVWFAIVFCMVAAAENLRAPASRVSVPQTRRYAVYG